MNGSYIFNKVNLYIVAGIIIIFAISINEIAIYVGHAEDRLSALYEKNIKAQGITYRTQEICQKKTQYICDYKTCDYKPGDPDFETTCGKNFKQGWRSSDRPIPPEYQNIQSLKFTIFEKGSKKVFELNPQNHTIASGSTSNIIDNPVLTDIRDVEATDITLILNRITIISLLSKLKDRTWTSGHTDALYMLAIDSLQTKTNELGLSTDWTLQSSGSCFASECPDEMLDLKSQIDSLWKSAAPRKN